MSKRKFLVRESDGCANVCDERTLRLAQDQLPLFTPSFTLAGYDGRWLSPTRLGDRTLTL
ncbi:hypothetical protein I8748_22840 [Nostoc sp. CENA67]|uniref:Uncharacterized protein n=1 Tax=Amazonocrinis nigriterrae CENA67 TaxID=2794033 RepID=A0A8J7HSC3_9NOST|nr:hypothetical protein [Amazonocrinis nigriterrae]MBH8564986.1 hypothetical protein [Amazonocrinis nigriterrae CENA67]